MPNFAVAMDARAKLACYPRGNFYSVINGVSTHTQRVTMSHFRDCSTCQSHSKACLCHYTLHSVSIGVEQTFEILRYILAGNRPSQTARLALSPLRLTEVVRSKNFKRRCYIGDSTQSENQASKSPSYTLQ